MITQELVKEYFEYRDGKLYWIKAPKNHGDLIGQCAGHLTSTNYLLTSLKGKRNKIHRLIFLMFYGYLPKIIDHIDGNSLNNRIENLRECTMIENLYNQKLSIKNTSGYKNVSWSKRKQKWIVKIVINKKPTDFGSYHDIQVAKFIAETMRHKYHQQFARSN
jgi:hypothetical protein